MELFYEIIIGNYNKFIKMLENDNNEFIKKLLVLPKIIGKKHVIIDNDKSKVNKRNFRPIGSNLKDNSEITEFLLKTSLLKTNKLIFKQQILPVKLIQNRYKFNDSLEENRVLIEKIHNKIRILTAENSSYKKTEITNQSTKDSIEKVQSFTKGNKLFLETKKEKNKILKKKGFFNDFTFCKSPLNINFKLITTIKDFYNLSKSRQKGNF